MFTRFFFACGTPHRAEKTHMYKTLDCQGLSRVARKVAEKRRLLSIPHVSYFNILRKPDPAHKKGAKERPSRFDLLSRFFGRFP